MKRLFISGFLLLAFVQLAVGQPAAFWLNNGTTNCPPSPVPQIDAINVTNNGTLNINRTTIFQNGFSVSQAPFEFSDMLNCTNRGTLSCNTGFDFRDFTSSGPMRGALFGNASQGVISGSSGVFFVTGFVLTLGGATINISSTNVVNNGTLEVSENGLIKVDGASVDLSRSSLICAGLQTIFLDTGFGLTNVTADNFSDTYWGLDVQTNKVQLGNFNLGSAFSPPHTITNASYQQVKNFSFPVANAAGFANVIQVNASNITTQVVIVGNTTNSISMGVRFEPSFADFAIPVVQWLSVTTNSFGVLVTNTLYLEDSFGARTNFNLYTNQSTIQTGIPLLSPTNFLFTSFDQFGFTNLPLGNTPYNPALIPIGGITNQYAAAGITLSAVSFTPDPNLPGQTFSNTPGRIEVTADNFLSLTNIKILGPNYLKLTSTNHFAGSGPRAQIAVPNLDINLGTTNGQLFITNLVAPFLPEFIGTVDVYSARWTNIVSGVTNSFNVLMVGSDLQPLAIPLVQNLALRSTNVVISDSLNVAKTFVINATSLTITSNSPGAQASYGQINLESPGLVWANALPTLQFLTNFGLITVPSTPIFEEVGQPPYFTNSFVAPYQAFVNHGSILSSGNTIWSTYFENSGISNLAIINSNTFTFNGSSITTNVAFIGSSSGPISITASNAVLLNGSLFSFAGDISLSAANLTVSNHQLQASGSLTFNVTNNMTDTGQSSNFWFVEDGINLLVKPATGDFLGTTIDSAAFAGVIVPNVWAAQDRGTTPAGFLNNAALGHVILDGQDVDSQFEFLGPDETNAYAIYIDQLDLQDAATNTLTSPGNPPSFPVFLIHTNVTVYFADAVIGNFDISEKLNLANGGRLVWVPAYAGFFSSTNLTNTITGVVNSFNRALVQSTDIDSNGNGIANAFDSNPIYTSGDVDLVQTVTNLPPRTPALTWFALANATNFLYHGTTPVIPLVASNLVTITKTNFLSNTNGVTFTNGGFILSTPSRTVTVADKGRTNSTGFYKVQVQPIQP